MTCPDENAIVAFAGGGLHGEARAWVEHHIDACSDCAQLACDAADQPDADGIGPTVVGFGSAQTPPSDAGVHRPNQLAPGTALGRYMVLHLLASGGIGQVYVAYDPDLDRKVALKLLRPLENDTVRGVEAQRWLLREAQAMAKLSHPNVVPVHDVGTHPAGVFVAMELIAGRTFSAWLREAERPWREVRDVLVEAGRGLSAAHAAGLVHRDFKPANILVGDDGRVRVVDFGLARAVAGPDVSPSPELDVSPADGRGLLADALTETGTIVGTPPFMAAEQFLGRNVGPWSDQFAFCATLHLGLYRVRPFPSRDLKVLRDSIVAGKVTAPPTTANVPDWLRRIVLRGLAANPDARHASMDAVLHALTRDKRSRKRQWFALGLVAVLSSSGAAVATMALAPAPTAQDREQVEEIAKQAREAAGRAHFLYPPKADAGAPTAYAGVLQLEAIEGPAQALANKAAAELRTEFATALLQLGDQYWEREGATGFASDYYAAAVIFGSQEENAIARMRMTPGQLGDLRHKARDRSFTPGELAAAEPLVALAEPEPIRRRRKLVAVIDDASGPPASVRAQLAEILEQPRGPASQPTSSAVSPHGGEVADTERVRAGADEPRKGAKGVGGRARTPGATEKRPGAAAVTEAPVVRDPKAAKEQVRLGKAALARGTNKAAAEHFHRALDHDPQSAAAVGGLCEAQYELSSYSNALKFCKRAVARAPKSTKYRLLLGDAYFKLLRYKNARAAYERAGELGAGAARGRLDMLNKKTGGAG